MVNISFKLSKTLQNLKKNEIYNHFFNQKKTIKKGYKINIKKNLKGKILESSKTFTVIAGSPKISNRVVSIFGNFKGIIGLGLGRSTNKIKARRLAFYSGKKNLINVPMTKNFSIPYFTWSRFCTSVIKLYPVFNNQGLKVGGSARTILEFAGYKNLTAVKYGSSSIINTANATFLALFLLAKKIERLTNEKQYYGNFFKRNLINFRNFVK